MEDKKMLPTIPRNEKISKVKTYWMGVRAD